MSNKPVYQIVMSTDGTHKVTVTIEDPNGTDAAIAWAKATYTRLIKDSDRPEYIEDDHRDEAPKCALHLLPMARVQGKLGPFWSCHQKNQDGTWCSYRPGR